MKFRVEEALPLLRSAGVLLLILGAASGALVSAYEAIMYSRAQKGDFGLESEIHKRVAAPLYAAIRPLDGGITSHGGDALILLYNTKCGPCKLNMANWMTLVSTLLKSSPRAEVNAVSVEPPEIQRAYWRSVSSTSVRLYSASNADSLVTALGTNTVPSTIVVHNGVITGTFGGLLGVARQKRLIRLLQ